MSRALELARHLEEGAFAPNILQNENAVRMQSAAELRRLAQVEAEHAALLKAISDAEPVAWSGGIEWHPIKHYQSEQVQKLTRKEQKEYGFTIPLYTLNGIKK